MYWPAAWPDRGRRKKLRRGLLLAALALWGGTSYWHTHKPLPPGIHVESAAFEVPATDLKLIADITAADAYGRQVLSHAIFDETLSVVRSAQRFLVLDYFLFNNQRGTAEVQSTPARAVSAELRDALIDRRQAQPQLQVLLILDPINEVYGSVASMDLALLRAAGVDVVTTDLDPLRDSNFLYSGLWRLTMKWWADPESRDEGWLPNPLDASLAPLTIGTWARLVNFKANHRKVIIGDDGEGGLVGIVASANPHDASSAHSNIAMKVRGPALEPLLASEIEIARLSGWRGPAPSLASRGRAGVGASPSAQVRILTEGAIRAQLLARLAITTQGDAVDIAMFYIADRQVVEALLAASQRGVIVRLILDPNKDAFGRTKNGIPNRPVASELVTASDGAIEVRWYRTHGEQFHTKLVMIYGPERLWLTLGSANLTRRNLADYNLEGNVAIEMPRGAQLAVQALEYFDTLWSNRAALGIEYTADFGVYADPAQTHYWLYRFMEATGLSTF